MGYGHPHVLIDLADLDEDPFVRVQASVLYGVGDEFAGSQQHLVEARVTPDESTDDGPSPPGGVGFGGYGDEVRGLIHWISISVYPIPCRD